ncbi:MAG TPA: dihydrofolate reductase family protein [Candidatus Dormibacteraeota bacterium]|nr:dihydrofolate reductase family protein [Candidatus Dormibacteraeota bacterium]
MGDLIYSSIQSLDGFNADDNGNFNWAAPDEEVHSFVNELLRPVGTYLYGRRMYEIMVYWETGGESSEIEREFAGIWRSADKIVYSRTLDHTSSARTRIERGFDPDAVRALKDSSAKDLAVGGPHLAAQALAAHLVDELQLFVCPVLVGAGNRALPIRTLISVQLTEQRTFGNGTIFLRYETVHS